MLKTQKIFIYSVCFILIAIELHDAFADNTNDYYCMTKDPTVFVDACNRHFQATLELNKKDGDVLLIIRSKENRGIELNLHYNFCRNVTVNESALDLEICSVEEIRLESVGMQDEEMFIKEIKLPASFGTMPDIHESNKKDFRKAIDKGIVILTKNEEFRKSEKIWDVYFWENLLKYTDKKPDKQYEITCSLTIKIDDRFYSASPSFVIDGKTVASLKRFRERWEQNEKNKPEEEYGKEFLLEFETNEKGDVLLKGKKLEE